MAKPIQPTPVLDGEDAEAVLNEVENGSPNTPERRRMFELVDSIKVAVTPEVAEQLFNPAARPPGLEAARKETLARGKELRAKRHGRDTLFVIEEWCGGTSVPIATATTLAKAKDLAQSYAELKRSILQPTHEYAQVNLGRGIHDGKPLEWQEVNADQWCGMILFSTEFIMGHNLRIYRVGLDRYVPIVQLT